MGKYGDAAIKAAELAAKSDTMSPRAAWETAVLDIFRDSPSSQKKSCPKDTFLTLCGLGAVKGVNPGRYTESTKGKSYAERGLKALRNNPMLSKDKMGLWAEASGDARIAHNQQMDVLIALFNKDLIRATEAA